MLLPSNKVFHCPDEERAIKQIRMIILFLCRLEIQNQAVILKHKHIT